MRRRISGHFTGTWTEVMHMKGNTRGSFMGVTPTDKKLIKLVVDGTDSLRWNIINFYGTLFIEIFID